MVILHGWEMQAFYVVNFLFQASDMCTCSSYNNHRNPTSYSNNRCLAYSCLLMTGISVLIDTSQCGNLKQIVVDVKAVWKK